MTGKKIMRLTERQERFCREYVVDMNATQAAIRTGHKASAAAKAGCRYMEYAEVTQFIAHLQRERATKQQITADMVIDELAKIGFCNAQAIMNTGVDPKELMMLGPGVLASVQGIKVAEVVKDGVCKRKVDIKLYNKVAALDKLSKHLGLFSARPEDSKPKICMVLSTGETVEI